MGLIDNRDFETINKSIKNVDEKRSIKYGRITAESKESRNRLRQRSAL